MSLLGSLRTILGIFEGFNGSGFVFVLALISIGFISVSDCDKSVKLLFVKYPAYVLLIFFCPIWWIYVSHMADYEILYRILWLIPLGGVCAFGMVKLVSGLKGFGKRVAFLFCLVVIVASGRYIYANPIYSKAENQYHIPEAVVEICDEISVPGIEVSACFPDEMLNYVRQYTPYICMPYGRDVLFTKLERVSLLRNELNSACPSASLVAEYLKNENCRYLVVRHDKVFDEALDGYLRYVTTIKDYDIYEGLTGEVGPLVQN